MYRFFSDVSNLKAVFGSYNTKQALIVKYTLDKVLKQLKIPSTVLLQQMQQEGLNLADFASQNLQAEPDAEWAPLSDAVIRNHLHSTFLDETKLIAAFSAMALHQQVEIRDLLTAAVGYLHLPSDTLLRKMEQEGLTLTKLGIAAADEAPASNVAAVRQKLQQLSAGPAGAIHEDVSAIRQRIAALQNTQALPSAAEQPEPPAGPGLASTVALPASAKIITLTPITEKRKAQG